MGLLQDLRYGLRVLLKSRAFTVVAVLTLALGIGANTAIFSVIDSVLLRPLPFRDPDQLVMVWESFTGRRENPVAPGNFKAWREQSRTFSDMAAYTSGTYNLAGDGEPEKLEGASATANLFALLGAEPQLGRTFTPEEDRPGGERVAVISHGLWQRRFGGSPAAVGSRVTIEGASHTIVGVMPPTFDFPTPRHAVWTPLALGGETAGSFMAHYLSVVARTRSGVTYEQAQAEMTAVAARLGEQYPQTNRMLTANVVPLKEQLVGNLRPALLILFSAAGFVLLVACTNVANLLLFRAAQRQKEIAVRLALGAARGRLVRQLLTESLLLSAAGGALGLLLAWWGVSLLASIIPPDVAPGRGVSLNLSVLGFTLLASALTGVFFGLAPAFQATRVNLNESLKEGGRDTARGRSGLRGVLVVAEVSLALVLLVGAGLMINSFRNLRRVDAGFDARGLLTLQVDPTLARYPNQPALLSFYERMIERIESLPGVESVGAVTRLPLTMSDRHYLFFADTAEGWKHAQALAVSSTPGYFRAMGIPVLQGRAFDARQDAAGSPGVVVVNEAMARLAWPNLDPVGRRVRMYPYDETAPTFTVVGVVKDVKQTGLAAEAKPQVYHSITQVMLYPPRDLVVRTSSNPMGLAAAVSREIWAVDREQPVSNIRTMEGVLAQSLSNQRFNTLLLTLFAALALALAAVGIYGVMSYTVTQSTRELGIRMALGAQRSDIYRLVVGQGMLLTFLGVGIGLAGAFALTRLMSRLLYGVGATDAATFAGVAAVLLAVAFLACYIPARRATKVDPMVALRYE